MTKAMNPVPVLLYHHIAPHPGDTVTVTPEVFASQMQWLSDEGYGFLSAGELLGHVAGTSPAEGKSVAITFDDGWLDNYLHAYPVMQRLGIKATMFVITARADAASLAGCRFPAEVPCHETAKGFIRAGEAERVVLDWQTIRAMAAGGLMSFHSHTLSHRRSVDLSEEELLFELAESKKTLQRELGRESDCLCWPYGSFNEQCMEIARRAGYQALFTTIDGLCPPASDLMRINRIEVADSLEWLRMRLATALFN